jgi:hypothetical protein
MLVTGPVYPVPRGSAIPRRELPGRAAEGTFCLMRLSIELAKRYVAVWNEPDAGRRRAAIEELWADDAIHVLQPPREVVDVATGFGLTAVFEAKGHDQLEDRVRLAYEQFVVGGSNSFRPCDDVVRLHDIVTFSWEMVAADGSVAGGGTEFLMLDDAGRIRADYQVFRG